MLVKFTAKAKTKLQHYYTKNNCSSESSSHQLESFFCNQLIGHQNRDSLYKIAFTGLLF